MNIYSSKHPHIHTVPDIPTCLKRLHANSSPLVTSPISVVSYANFPMLSVLRRVVLHTLLVTSSEAPFSGV